MGILLLSNRTFKQQCAYTAYKNELLVTMLMKTGLNNVLLLTLFNVSSKIV